MGALALVPAAALVLAACGTSRPTAPRTDTVTAAGNAVHTPPPTRTATHHRPSPAQIAARARTQLSKIIHAEPAGGVSVAVRDLKTGKSYAAGATSGMWTASAYKLLLVVGLLLRDGSVSDDTASRALENSDNAAGYDLFLDLGGNTGEQRTIDQLGMSHTEPGNTDPTFTTTSASDYLKVLAAVATPGTLSADDRSYVLELMHNVEADQRWGVGAAADEGTPFANKNGWLSVDDTNGPGEEDDGLWAVSSVGIVTVGGHRLLMSVFTQHQRSFDTGVALTERLARPLARTVVPRRH